MDIPAAERDKVGTEPTVETESTSAVSCYNATSIKGQNLEEKRGNRTESEDGENVNGENQLENEFRSESPDTVAGDNGCKSDEAVDETRSLPLGKNGNTVTPRRSLQSTIFRLNNHLEQEERSSYSHGGHLEGEQHIEVNDSATSRSQLQTTQLQQSSTVTLVSRSPSCNYLHHAPCSILERQRRTIVCPSCFNGDLKETREVFDTKSLVEYQRTDMHESNIMDSSDETLIQRPVKTLKEKDKEEKKDRKERSVASNRLHLLGLQDEGRKVERRHCTKLQLPEVDSEIGSLAESDVSEFLQCHDSINADSCTPPITQYDTEEQEANTKGSCTIVASCSPLSSGRPTQTHQPLRCHVVVLKQGLDISYEWRFTVCIIPTANLDELFGIAWQDKMNTQGSLECYFEASVFQYVLLDVSICGNSDFWISDQSKGMIPHDRILQHSCQRLIGQGLFEFRVERNSDSYGFDKCEAMLIFESKGSSKIIEKFLIKSYHWKEKVKVNDEIGMPQKDRNVIRSCFAPLVNEIRKVDKLLVKLRQSEILDEDDVERIGNPKRNRKEQVRSLLFMVQRKGDVLGDFTKSLETTNKKAAKILYEKRHQIQQGETAKRETGPMPDKDKRSIIQRYEKLTDLIQEEYSILDECYSCFIFDEDDIEDIAKHETKRDRVSAILDLFMKTGGSLDTFKNILRSVRRNTKPVELLEKSSMN